MSATTEQDYLLTTPGVARSFGRAAKNYEQANALQLYAGEQLMDALEYMTLQARHILDLGAGPGTSTGALQSKYRKSYIVELDLSLPMLKKARSKMPRFFPRRAQVCADASHLPVADGSVDLVFSNLMLQWVNNPETVFEEVRRALKPGGLFVFSTFGPDTLQELRQSWALTDDKVHVNAFIDMHDLGDALVRAGMQDPIVHAERTCSYYPDVFSLMKELKALGAHNINAGRSRGLTGKKKLQKMLDEYEALREDQGIPASYELVYGHAWRSQDTASGKMKDGSTAVPLSVLTEELRSRKP